MEYEYDKDSFMRPEQILYRRCGQCAKKLFPITPTIKLLGLIGVGRNVETTKYLQIS